MNKNLLIGIGAGAVCVAIAVWGIVYMQRGAHLQMPGKFLKMRTAPLEDNSSLAMVDFRITNASDYAAAVRSVSLVCEEPNGNRIQGIIMADQDAQRVFDAFPILGQKYNASLKLRDAIPPRATWDRMVGARFEVPEDRLLKRTRFIVVVEEVDKGAFEISEN
jgi:hypothetical protein